MLNGKEPFFELAAAPRVDGERLPASAYVVEKDGDDTVMIIKSVPITTFTLEITTKFKPQENTELSGLYKSSGTFCTQCEAEGFRSITYYPDRPDVMSVFTTKITADKTKYPVLLSNGNLVETETSADGNAHSATWKDPWRKPCYLFALVAGDLAVVEDSFTTMSGREVALKIYAEHKNIDRCDFAMASLKRAMKWDEERFGLEYDLDLFNIVAVDDFNMGAMENKSLNIFNSRLVLASEESATDATFERIEGVIGHEYFHNYTGNRVTCRDWFQLSLKEGLTVFRDHEFTSDLHSRAVKRIADVRYLRAAQFAEDASPLAHPVRPEAYQKIDNFYTLTVYEKGSELIRMYHTLLGKDGFRKGMDLYFQRHDGQAVTTEDFFAAMSDANSTNIEKLKRWYSQAGTPALNARGAYDADAKTYALTLTQTLPTTNDVKGAAEKKLPQLIPVAVGLLGADGADMVLGEIACEGDAEATLDSTKTTAVCRLTEFTQTFTFKNVPSKPVPSILRGFSAPVKLTVEPELDTDDLLFLLANDSDEFNRWEAAQKIATSILIRLCKKHNDDETLKIEDVDVTADPSWAKYSAACRGIIVDAASNALDRAWVEEALSFPGTSQLIQDLAPGVNPVNTRAVCKAFSRAFAKESRAELEAALATCDEEARGLAYDVDGPQVARRALRGYVIRMLGSIGGDDVSASLAGAYSAAKNMTDTVSALNGLCGHVDSTDAKNAAFDDFLQKWRDDNNVSCTWLRMVASEAGKGTGDAVGDMKTLMASDVYDAKNPNKFYSLIGGFAGANIEGFHAADGSGYEFVADVLLQADAVNPQASSRMASPFTKWRLYDEKRQGLIKAQLERMFAHKLSPNLYEIVSKAIKG